jgi:hypothetical protein
MIRAKPRRYLLIYAGVDEGESETTARKLTTLMSVR